ncbi:hypothetical protein T459_31821 [Capsicum annuum]|uniref:Uncharacterized protein n=1 Tax=Capsicum annuum TaxID=4072 RepID=A0A2G2Y3I0_CAPAN|nr:hypothetical protein T459_31821 [Capsicum annuum]
MHHMAGGLPHRVLRDLANKYGPLMHLQLGEVSAVVVTSSELAKQVLKIHDLAFASRPKLSAMDIICYDSHDIVFSPYGEYLRQMRKICVMELLSAKNIWSFSSIRHDEVNRLIESIRSYSSSGELINFTERVIWFTSCMICRSAFGKVLKEQDEFIKLIGEVVSLAGGFDVADIFPSYKFLHSLSLAKKTLLRCPPLMKDRSLQFPITNDSIKAIIDVSIEYCACSYLINHILLPYPYPYIHIKINYKELDMFAAGTETSSATTVWAMVEMMKNPSTLAKAQAEVRQAFRDKVTFDKIDVEELKYLKLVVKETMRFHAPVPLLWEEDVSRDVIWFSTLANVYSLLAQLLYHFDWKLPTGMEPRDLDVSESSGATATRTSDLYLIATPYQP